MEVSGLRFQEFYPPQELWMTGVSPSVPLESCGDMLLSNLQQEKPLKRKQECECRRPSKSSESHSTFPATKIWNTLQKPYLILKSSLSLLPPPTLPHNPIFLEKALWGKPELRARLGVGDYQRKWLQPGFFFLLFFFLTFLQRSWPILSFHGLDLIKKEELLSTTLFQLPKQWLSKLHCNTNFRKREAQE